ncbi:hypothetical protein [Hymenobacter volaticus]|uniref:DoxX family protein n=1 Tax=Hymenobacter volaticus TaxID=2932254 RepID=A0ABY4GFJ6_9BACT|nr:hypothetical protein [Hymenobacter volaticus]UOQ69099.1 hypothetical protein MUN86_26750 [Hymenobacter volaticus]
MAFSHPRPLPWARLVGALFLATGVAIVRNRKGQAFSLALFGLLFVLLCLSSIPYELFIDPYHNYVGSWTNALTNLALTGGAMTIAGSYHRGQGQERQGPVGSWPEKVALAGKIFFSITILIYGITHFLYTKHLVPLVPSWLPYPFFWTYFTGGALMGAGSALLLGIQQRRIAFLLGLMIFLWVFLVHLPRALALPAADSQPIRSLFTAVVYSGTAFVIAVLSSERSRKRHAKGILGTLTASCL